MKKIISFLAFSIFTSATLSADFVRVEMGVGAWASKAEGQMSYTESGVTASDIPTKDTTANPYAWILIKQPIPLVPNLRLEYSDITTKGLAAGTFKEFTTISANTKTQLDMTQFDVIPYYNILDNTFWVTLDLGLDIKVIDMSYTAEAVTVATVTADYSDSKARVFPMAYLRTRVEIPTTDIGLEADIKYVSYDGSTVYDARVKVDYTLSMFPVLEPAIEVGYRIQKYDLNNEDIDAKVNLKFSGVYAGLIVRF